MNFVPLTIAKLGTHKNLKILIRKVILGTNRLYIIIMDYVFQGQKFECEFKKHL